MRLGQVENVSHEKANYILGCSRKSNNGLREVVFPTLIVSESTSRVLSPILVHLVQERLANWCKSRGEHLKRVEHASYKKKPGLRSLERRKLKEVLSAIFNYVMGIRREGFLGVLRILEVCREIFS